MNTYTTTTPVIINLHNLTAGTEAEAASSRNRPICFVSAVHPKQLLGHLWDEENFTGAWIENFRIITRLEKKVQVFEAPGFQMDDPMRLVTWVLENLLRGASASVLQAALDRSSAKTLTPVI